MGIISVYPSGANLEASAYLSDRIRKRWPMHANTPIAAIIDHWFKVGLIQTKGIINETITAPTKPVIKSVNKGLSDLLNFRVIIK